MTTEAEEFKKQEERFLDLNDKFQEVWLHKQGIRLQAMVGSGTCALRFVFPPQMFWETENVACKKSEALRALNDRLEIALQGKTNG